MFVHCFLWVFGFLTLSKAHGIRSSESKYSILLLEPTRTEKEEEEAICVLHNAEVSNL